ncbi:rex4 [Scenedesmus sp. PABB004]|nr:rex4 [Scenedesmus sp. PABB004]
MRAAAASRCSWRPHPSPAAPAAGRCSRRAAPAARAAAQEEQQQQHAAAPPGGGGGPGDAAGARGLDVEYAHYALRGAGPGEPATRAVPAWVALVDAAGRALLVTRVAPPADLPPGAAHVGGVPPAETAGAPPLGDVMRALAALAEGRLLVGHGLAKDLAALAWAHPARLRFDMMAHPAFCNAAGNARSLRRLAAAHLGLAIQGGEPPAPPAPPPARGRRRARRGPPPAPRPRHDPVEDAAAAMRLFQEARRRSAQRGGAAAGAAAVRLTRVPPRAQVVVPASYDGRVAAATEALLRDMRARRGALDGEEGEEGGEEEEAEELEAG